VKWIKAYLYLFWVLTSLLIAFSSWLWCYEDYAYSDKLGGMWFGFRFGFPAKFFHTNYEMNTTEPYLYPKATSDFSPAYFALNYFFYFVVLAVPVLTAGAWITEREKIKRQNNC
jgi:hypothetical protein